MHNEMESPSTNRVVALGGKKVIKTSTGFIVIFAGIVLFFGAAMTFWNFYRPADFISSSNTLTITKKTNSNANSSNSNANGNGNANANVNHNINSSNANANTNTVATPITYTNSTYGFTLTLPANWSTYKVKVGAVEGAAASYYFELPTSDSFYQTASTSNDAGYAGVFFVGVMNKADWTGDEIQQRDFGSKMGENSSYVFTSGSAQADPNEMAFTTARSQIQTIIDTFTLQ